MKKLLLSLLMFLPILASAQTMKETRVYYLDCTYTMVKPNAVWDEVRDNLKRAINNVQDENTQLVVIPFWDKSKTLTPYRQFATDEGKRKLCKTIDNLDCPRKSYTLLGTPLMDFYENRVNSGQNNITYMFFMTDGENEDENEKEVYGKVMFYDKLKEWGQRYGNEQVYGFYVMLCESAKSAKIENIIETQPHLWKVETADININIVRLGTNSVYNARNDEYAYIPVVDGNASNVNLKVESENNQYYKVKESSFERDVNGGDKLRLAIEPASEHTLASIPNNVKLNLLVSMEGEDEYTFLITDKITLNCLNEKAFGLTMLPERLKGKLSHYNKFLWKEGWKSEPIDTTFRFDFNDDAKAETSCFAEFALVDKDGRTVSQNEMILYVDSEKTVGNTFRVSSTEDRKEISFDSGPDLKGNGRFLGYLKITRHNLNSINNQFLNSGDTVEIVSLSIRHDKKMNPLAFILMCVGIAIVAFLFIWYAFMRPSIYPHFGRMTKNVLIKQNGKIIKQKRVVFKGARAVYFAPQKVRQSWFKRLFTGKIVTLADPIFVDSLKFMPWKKGAMASGLNYTVMSNPIPRSGVTTIKNAALNFEITLN